MPDVLPLHYLKTCILTRLVVSVGNAPTSEAYETPALLLDELTIFETLAPQCGI
jgi:hypothetical protein